MKQCHTQQAEVFLSYTFLLSTDGTIQVKVLFDSSVHITEVTG